MDMTGYAATGAAEPQILTELDGILAITYEPPDGRWVVTTRW